MDTVRFRLAKPSDARALANVHYSTRDKNDMGIFAQMRKGFLTTYYKIILNEPNEVVLCAEKNGKIVGINSFTLDAEKQQKCLRRNMFRLGFSALGTIICKPRIIVQLFRRFISLKKNSDNKFILSSGTRGEFWGWDPSESNPEMSIELNETAMLFARLLKCNTLPFEVDIDNRSIYKFHKINGATEKEKIVLSDGRERVLMEYDLTNRKQFKRMI